MEFSREGKTIRCVISEEEIEELGFTIDDIISNGTRTQEFMNQIFDMAEEEFQTKFDLGIKAVRADILPDHTISLTFSEHPGSENMMEHIKDIVNGLLNTIPKQKWDEIKAIKDNAKTQDSTEKTKNQMRIIALFAFEELDVLIRYAKKIQMEAFPFNQLYRLDDIYFLMIDMTDCNELEAKKMSALTDEYAVDVFIGAEKRAYIYEHGTPILTDRALEQLREV